MTRLSNLQYPMLRALSDLRGEYMTIEQAQHYDQRPFRSMLIQEWAAFRPGHGFHITKKGKKALYEFTTTDIGRKDPSLPLTAYFDATAYGLSPKKVKHLETLHLIRRRGAA